MTTTTPATAKEALTLISPCYTGENSFSHTIPMSLGVGLRHLLLEKGFTRKVSGSTVDYRKGGCEFTMDRDGDKLHVYTYLPGYSCD